MMQDASLTKENITEIAKTTAKNILQQTCNFKMTLPSIKTNNKLEWNKIYDSFNEMFPKMPTYFDMKSPVLMNETNADIDKSLEREMVTKNIESKHSLPTKSKRGLEREKKKLNQATAGEKWFNFKAPELTDEVKRDLEVLQLRHIHDPKRFYKHNDRKTLPKYFQIGRVMDNAADFYSSRVAKKDRKQSLAEELLADAKFKQYQRRKYKEVIMRRMNSSTRRRVAKKQFQMSKNKQRLKQRQKKLDSKS